jgi:hypothetical protein
MNDDTTEDSLPAPELDHISTVRRHMLDQLRALRTAPRGEELSLEIRRSKAVTEVAQTIINAARVERLRRGVRALRGEDRRPSVLRQCTEDGAEMVHA